MAKVDLVEVSLEDLVLLVVALHLACRGLLAELPAEAPVRAVHQRRVHVADELLRDRAGAARAATHSVLERACNAHHVHAVVLVEALVLDGDEGLRDVFGKRRNGDARAQLDAHLTDQRSVAREDHRRLRRTDNPPRVGGVGARWRRLCDCRLRGDRPRGHRSGGKLSKTHVTGTVPEPRAKKCTRAKVVVPLRRNCDPAHRSGCSASPLSAERSYLAGLPHDLTTKAVLAAGWCD